MCVNVQIALRLDLKIQHPVTCNLVEHVIEEGDTGRQTALSAAIKVQSNRDLRFQGVSADFGLPHVISVAKWQKSINPTIGLNR